MGYFAYHSINALCTVPNDRHGRRYRIDLAEARRLTDGNWYLGGGKRYVKLSIPELQLHCPYVTCNGPRFFRYDYKGNLERRIGEKTLIYLTYRCDNCKRSTKTFSLYIALDPKDATAG